MNTGSLFENLICTLNPWSAMAEWKIKSSFSVVRRHIWLQLTSASRSKSIRMTPELKPLPIAGHGFLFRLPGMYQSLLNNCTNWRLLLSCTQYHLSYLIIHKAKGIFGVKVPEIITFKFLLRCLQSIWHTQTISTIERCLRPGWHLCPRQWPSWGSK